MILKIAWLGGFWKDPHDKTGAFNKVLKFLHKVSPNLTEKPFKLKFPDINPVKDA